LGPKTDAEVDVAVCGANRAAFQAQAAAGAPLARLEMEHSRREVSPPRNAPTGTYGKKARE